MHRAGRDGLMAVWLATIAAKNAIYLIAACARVDWVTALKVHQKRLKNCFLTGLAENKRGLGCETATRRLKSLISRWQIGL